MKFRILGIKDNSVRVRTGIVTIDIKVIDGDSLKIELPPSIYIASDEDWKLLRDAVIASYINSKVEINSKNDETQVYNRKWR